MARETARKPLGGVLTLLGGAAIVAGSFLKWGKVTLVATGANDQVKAGSIVLFFGIGVIVVGLLMLIVPSRGGRVALGIIAILAGLLTLLIAGVAAGSKDVILNSDADRVADARGLDRKTAEEQFKTAEANGQLKVTVLPGVFITLGGGLLVLVGGIAGLRSGPRTPTTEVPQPAGWGQPTGAPPAYGQQTGVPPPQTGVPPPGPPPPPGQPPPPPDPGYSG
jgi:hypothetical protein